MARPADMSPDMSAPETHGSEVQKLKWEILVLDHDYCLRNFSLSETI
jgi:hypothetical protein